MAEKSETKPGSPLKAALTIAALALLAVGILAAKGKFGGGASAASGTGSSASAQTAPEKKAKLPTLVDLGAGKCVPCKAMAPILEELKKAYEGRMDVVFIDVREQAEEAGKYGIKLIPTQIFFDAEGKELFRHEGFFSREDILAKWKELGHEFGASKPEPQK